MASLRRLGLSSFGLFGLMWQPITLLSHPAMGLLLRRRPGLSALLFGLLLSFEHLGRLLRDCLLTLASPALLSLPFLLQAPEGFLFSVVFSLSREVADHAVANGSTLLLSPLAQIMERLGFWLANTVIFLLFVQFSTVVFGRDFTWALSVGLIAAAAYSGMFHYHQSDPGSSSRRSRQGPTMYTGDKTHTLLDRRGSGDDGWPRCR